MKLKNNETIRTQRLTLRPFSDGDTEEMIAMLCDDEIKKTYMIPDLHDREKQMKMFNRFKELSGSDEHFVYGIAAEGKLVGFMNEVDVDGSCVELGYVISPAHKGRGYATEALCAAIDELFAVGLTCVRTGAFEENAASIRVMEKSGMTRTEQVDFIEYRGKNHRCVYYEKRKS